MQALIDYLEGLEVTQGEGIGQAFPLFPWERKFIKGAFSARGHAGLTVGRGNGKTTLLAGVGSATVDPDGPLHIRRGAMPQQPQFLPLLRVCGAIRISQAPSSNPATGLPLWAESLHIRPYQT